MGILFVARRLGQSSPLMTILLSHAVLLEDLSTRVTCSCFAKVPGHVFSVGYGNQRVSVFRQSRNSYLLDGRGTSAAEKMQWSIQGRNSLALFRWLAILVHHISSSPVTRIRPIKKFDWTRFGHSG